MHHLVRLCRFLVLLLFFPLPPLAALAQVSNVTDVEATPIPGAGHDYIGILGETVNPANGSLSIRIQVPVPKGRALNLPFAIAYDSSGGGSWSYTLPSLSAGAAKTVKQNFQGDPEICKYSAGFIFTDPMGTRHAFPNMVYVASDFTDTCSDLGYSTNLSDSDPLITARPSGTGVAVQDADGTTYSFTMGEVPTPIVTAIEDRNGNRVTYNTQSTNVTAVTDTAGRVVLSTNGLGGTGSTVNVSGLSNPYTTSTGGGGARTYDPAFTRYLTAPPADTCPAPPPQSQSDQGGGGIGTLTLPNNESYTFTYDQTYGNLNEIIYPNGGWVKYTWGLNPQSEAYFGNASPQGLCGWRFGNPVITERQVSFDGSTIAEEQDFTYSTAWTDSNNDLSALKWTSKSTTVTSYDEIRSPSKGLASATVYTYAPVSIQGVVYSAGGGIGTLVPVESTVVNKDWNGSVLQTVNTSWVNQYLKSSEQTVLPNGSASQANYLYGTLGVPTEHDEYDYGKTTATRKTVTKYQTFSANSLGSTIYDRPCQTIIEDGSNNRFAETDYFYDGGATGTVCGTSGAATTTSVSDATLHDETNYGPSSTSPRGNATQENRWLNTGSSPVTTLSYDETGQVLSVTDACGNGPCADLSGTDHITTYQYTDSYTSGLGTPSGNTNAYVTKMIDPLGHTVLHSFGYNDGQPSSSTDQNSQTISYKYNTPPSGCSLPDGLDRLSEVDYPDGGKTTYCYNDAGSSPSMTTSQLLNSSNVWKTNLVVMDGLGHTVHSELTSDPIGTDIVDTTYDGMGKPYTVSNPHRSTSWPTDGTSTYYYDAVGRTTKVAEQDGSLLQTCYNGVASIPSVVNCSSLLGSVGSGSWVDSTDELLNHWQRTSDSFGRLTEVMEPNGTTTSPTMETDYSYSILDNLTFVTQWGGASGSSGARVRSFAYDSLSRLLCSSNPENSSAACPTSDAGAYVSGTTGYTYDMNGNLSAKTSPLVNAGSGSQTISYCYDTLNRSTYRFYSSSPNCTTPSGYVAAYTYDSSPVAGAALVVGRLTDAKAYVNSLLVTESKPYIYDQMGRLKSEQQCPYSVSCSTPYTFNYTYDYAGSVTSSQNGLTAAANALSFAYTYDAAERLEGVTVPIQPSSWSTTTYPTTLLQANGTSPAAYDPMGHMVNGGWGLPPSSTTPAIAMTRQYDNRGRRTAETDNNGSLYGYAVPTGGYLANSNLYKFADLAIGGWQFSYDTLNRLSMASASTGVYSGESGCWTYDAFGNRNLEAFSTVTSTPCAQGANDNTQSTITTPTTNNRVTGFLYDVAGNVLSDGQNSYMYDAEGRLCSVAANVGMGNMYYQYIYDASGRRTAAGVVTSLSCAAPYAGNGFTLSKQYLLGSGGEQVTELGGTGGTVPQHTNVWPGGGLAATYDFVNGGLHFDLSDPLGTKRVQASGTGVAELECVSLPFGNNIGNTRTPSCTPVVGHVPDATEHEFTGKERDTESGLDNFGARYMASMTGRFISPDPSNLGVDLFLPQTWNRYTYALNNPLSMLDKNGLWPTWVHDDIIDRAFPTLSSDQRDLLKNASKAVDDDQSARGSYKHGMVGASDVTDEAFDAAGDTQKTQDWIAQNEHDAQEIQQAWMASGNSGIAPAALTAFGNALHTITDMRSPSHEGGQYWYGHPIANAPRSITHFIREAWPWGGNRARRRASVTAAQQAWIFVFPPSKPEPPQQPSVTFDQGDGWAGCGAHTGVPCPQI